MDAIAVARALLPPWVVWGNALLYPLTAFLLSLFGAWLGVRIASAPQRHLAPSAPWTERARRTFPARLVATRTALIAFLGFGALGFFFAGPCNRLPGSILGLLGGAAAYLAATCIRWRVVRRTALGATGLRAWLRGLLSDGLILHSYLLIVFLLFVLLPDRLDTTALIMLTVALALLIFYTWGGGLILAHAAGLARRADERLQKIVERAAAKTGIRPRATYELISTTTYAAALLLPKRLVFTQSILKELDDEELTAVCVHELGHLTEPLLVVLCRLSPLLLFTALGAGRLIFALGGLPALVVLNVAFLLAVILLLRLSQRMERRADRIAAGDKETEAVVYARALEKIYQANLFPAVLPGRLGTHPHLYDRLVAAGVMPDYERPRPPSRVLTMTALMAPLVLIGALLIGKLALLIVGFPVRMRGNEPVVLTSLALGGSTTELSHLAYLHFKRDDKEGAVVFYRAVTELDPNSVSGPTNLAITLARLDRCKEAREAAVEAALRCAHNNSPANKILLKSAFDALRWCQARRRIAQNAAPSAEEEVDP